MVSTIFASDLLRSGANLVAFVSIFDVISKYATVVTIVMIPILQSKNKIMTMKTKALTKPPNTITNKMAPFISTFSKTVVQTPVNSPKLLSLKYPIGTDFKRSPMESLFNAVIKYPACVCCS